MSNPHVDMDEDLSNSDKMHVIAMPKKLYEIALKLDRAIDDSVARDEELRGMLEGVRQNIDKHERLLSWRTMLITVGAAFGAGAAHVVARMLGLLCSTLAKLPNF